MTLVCQIRRTKGPIDDEDSITGSPESVVSSRCGRLPTQFNLSVPQPSCGTVDSLIVSKTLELNWDIMPDMTVTFHGNCGGTGEMAVGPSRIVYNDNDGIVSAASKNQSTAGVEVFSPKLECSDDFSSDVRCRSVKVGDCANEPLPFCDVGAFCLCDRRRILGRFRLSYCLALMYT
jgi:hypothetical protein